MRRIKKGQRKFVGKKAPFDAIQVSSPLKELQGIFETRNKLVAALDENQQGIRIPLEGAKDGKATTSSPQTDTRETPDIYKRVNEHSSGPIDAYQKMMIIASHAIKDADKAKASSPQVDTNETPDIYRRVKGSDAEELAAAYQEMMLTASEADKDEAEDKSSEQKHESGVSFSSSI